MINTIPLIVFTDGRGHLLQQTLQSFDDQVRGPIGPRLIIDDSANADYAAWLDKAYAGYTVIHHPQRLGFTRTIIAGLSHLPTCEFFFWLEDDFLFNQPIDLSLLVDVLREQPHLAQIVLKRQAWNEAERAAGGIVEQRPTEYLDQHWGARHWLEHSLFFSTNPSLTRKAALDEVEWPDEPHSEGMVTFRLRRAGYQFAFWGQRSDSNWVTHIGMERIGNGY